MDQLLHDELKHMCETRRDIDTTERSKARWNAIIALIDAALAEPKKLSTCPECGGSGVYQEYDEYDRYTVHACAKCGGSGELLAEPDADVAEAIGSLESDCEYGEQQEQNKVAVDVFDLRKAITALRQYQKPTDEAVQRAIEFYEMNLQSRNEDKFPEDDVSRRFRLVLSALRQMRSEPCEICGIEKLPDIDCHDPLPHEYWVWKGALWLWFGDYGGWEGSEISNCPNCGRKLVG